MPEEFTACEKSKIKNKVWEKKMLREIAGLLAKEKLINPKEYLCFLSIVQKEE